MNAMAMGGGEPSWRVDPEATGPLRLVEYAQFLGFDLMVTGLRSGPTLRPPQPQRPAAWAWSVHWPSGREAARGLGLHDRASARAAAVRVAREAAMARDRADRAAGRGEALR